MEEAGEEPLFCERAAGIDIGKQLVMVTIRPSDIRRGGRAQETRGFGTTRRQLLELADWLRVWGVERAGMESTSDYVRCDGAWVQVGGAAGGRFRPQAQYPGQCALARLRPGVRCG
ncbi:hypothetical protein EAS64_07245 [Trebonia kvetii]|uniref:Uncharacterized protein n=1 Tax=Trebonia kvetii TaxID=2480626 RepID=A0A6P2C6N6_9ACTN|nr:hypothetical protein [Trebonia kvetii]TVZ07102.1 hypothetical protein EAS64_07245 [Trebonia kvetii]